MFKAEELGYYKDSLSTPQKEPSVAKLWDKKHS